MEEITIVKRRSRLWPALLMLAVLALLVLAALWVMGDRPVDMTWDQLIQLGRRTTGGIT